MYSLVRRLAVRGLASALLLGIASHPAFGLPIIEIEKLVNGQDADLPPGPFLPVGSAVSFSYRVANPGDESLSGVVVRDDNGTPANPADDFNAVFAGGDVNADGRLDLDETWLFAAAEIATAGQHQNTAFVSGIGVTGSQVTDADSANYFGLASAIDVEKLVNGADADSPPGPSLPVGSAVSFSYQVVNPGNASLGSVFVLDDNGTPANPADDFSPVFVSGDVDADGRLGVSETWLFAATEITTAGQQRNTGFVTGLDLIGSQVTDSDSANYFGVTQAVPEPATLALLVGGFVGFAGRRLLVRRPVLKH